MAECQYCGTELKEKYNFCLNCERQAKCTNCSELLLPNKQRCLVCGAILAERKMDVEPMNEFTLEEEQTADSAQRRINGRFTNKAFGHAAALFGGLPRSKITPQSYEVPSHEGQALPSLEGQEGTTNRIEGSTDGQDLRSEEATPEKGREDGSSEASRYFKLRGEELVSQFSDFKGPTKKAQQERFILLYTWAYNELVERSPTKEQLVEASRKRKLHDTNFANYYSDVANQYLLGGEEELELNPDGQRKIPEILQEMDDESVEQGFAYWKGANPSRAKRSTTSAKDKQEISQWVDMNIDIGNVDVRALDTPTNCAMFAIWCLTTRLKVTKAVKPSVALSYIKSRYTTISVDQKSFTKALGRAKNGHRFNKNGEGLYYLTTHAEREVESWVTNGVPKSGETESADEK